MRALGPADAEPFSALRREALRDAPLAFAASPEQDGSSDPAVARVRLGSHEEARVFGAFSGDDELVGAIGVRREPSTKKRHQALVWGMYVKPAHRRRGVAGALLDEAVGAARAMGGVDWLMLSVSATAETARRLYERAGFRAFGTEPDALRLADETHASVDETHMALHLAAADPETLLRFWFGEGESAPQAFGARVARWFGGDPEFDQALAIRFAELAERAARGELDGWTAQARSTLALVLALDQLPRNLHRRSARAFAADARALEVAEQALASGVDRRLAPAEAAFLYLPLEHAEDLARQERCVSLFRALVERAPEGLRPFFRTFVGYAERHRDVIARFGRFPHRNAILGRPATRDEQAFLAGGGDDFSTGEDEPSKRA